MHSTALSFDQFTDDTRWVILLGGLFGIAGTIAISTPIHINTAPVLLGAAISGFLYGRGIDGGHRVGKWVGAIGTLSLVPLVPWILEYSGPMSLVVAAFSALAVVFTVLGGMLGGVVGGVVRSKLERVRRSPVAA